MAKLVLGTRYGLPVYFSLTRRLESGENQHEIGQFSLILWPMKPYLLFVIMFISLSGAGQIPEVQVIDSTFTRVLNIYIDSLNRYGYSENLVIQIEVRGLTVESGYYQKNDQKFGMVTIPKYHLSYDLDAFLTRSPSSFRGEVPSSWFVHRNRRVYVSFGGGYFFKLKGIDEEKLKRDVKRHLGVTQLGDPTMANMHFQVVGKRISSFRMLR